MAIPTRQEPEIEGREVGRLTKAVLIVRRLSDSSEVHRVGLHVTNERHVDRVMMGLLRNMDTEIYYVDDSEVEE